MQTFVCEKCGSEEIRIKAWVNINTYEFFDTIEDVGKDCYCPVCKDYKEAIPESKYMDNYEPDSCGWCSGTGEGMHDGSRCAHCNGKGYIQ